MLRGRFLASERQTQTPKLQIAFSCLFPSVLARFAFLSYVLLDVVIRASDSEKVRILRVALLRFLCTNEMAKWSVAQTSCTFLFEIEA